MRVGVKTQAIAFTADRPSIDTPASHRAPGLACGAYTTLWNMPRTVRPKLRSLPSHLQMPTPGSSQEFASGDTPSMEIIVSASVTDASRYLLARAPRTM